ncbi:MAG TPA: RusA family crossover junction endodeoxyribonuclease [Nitrosomonas sp.]|nr:RusA family crossover junction endodeoxyribonuclease [Agitococcus sp.]HNA70003.1 RusA family crossover junction endodeoxyribonuclease [Nitrosomonas sp.]
MFECEIPLEAVAKQRPRAFYNKKLKRASVYTPQKTVSFELMVRFFISQNAGYELLDNPFKEPVKLTCGFFLKSPKKPRFECPGVKPDLDNYIKSVLDAMNGLILVDDALVCEIDAFKRYATGNPYIYIKLESI